MNNLRIFTNYTPNVAGEKHFIYNTALNPTLTNEQIKLRFLVKISNEATAKNTYDFEVNTYKAFSDHIDIYPEAGGIAEPYAITYAILTTPQKPEYTFYYVDSIERIPQGYRLTVRQDLWAMYIGIAKLDNISFTRSNILLTNSTLYKTTERVSNSAIKTFKADNSTYTRSQFRFLAYINYVEDSRFDTSINRVSAILFTPFNQEDVIEITGDDEKLQIEAMYEAVQNIVATTGDKKAYVEKLYVVFANDNYQYADFKTTLYGKNIHIKGQAVEKGIFERPRYIINAPNYTPWDGIYPSPVKINKVGSELYFGTKYNALKLPSFVGVYTVNVIYEVGSTELKVTVTNGTDSRDITQNFTLAGNATKNALSPLQQMSKALGIVSNVAGGIFQMGAGGAGIISGGTQIANTFLNTNENSNGAYLPNGDGIITTKEIVNKGSGSLFFISSSDVENLSAQDEIKQKGAVCEYYNRISNIFEIFNNHPKLINTGDYPIFIACDLTATNIPTEAREHIQQEFSNGVKIEIIQ